MRWHVEFAEEFAEEVPGFDPAVRAELLAHAELLEKLGAIWAGRVRTH